MKKKFYVYVHIRLDSHQVFYVGKGCGGRLFNKTHRSEYWKRISEKHGFKAEKIVEGLSEPCAFTLEKITIAKYRRENLCNLSDGGEGVSNPTEECRAAKSSMAAKSKNPMFKKDLYGFWNERFGSVFCSQYTLRKSFGLKSTHVSRLVSGKVKSVSGWVLLENKGVTLGKHGPNKSTRLLSERYVNKDGREWVGNFRDFQEEFSLNPTNVYKMRTGRKASYKGWTIDGPA